MPAYNEADVLRHSLLALIEDGIDVHVIDNCSTDETGEIARSLLGRGVVAVERYPDDSGGDERARDQYAWQAILTRIGEIGAAARDYDWIVFTNPDEFRESPWPDRSFREGLALVHELGFTAVNFDLFNFRPIDDDFVPGADVRDHLHYWERGDDFDIEQIKAWRNLGPAEVAASGGHSIAFPGRRVFPIPFILRHYPIRSETHGRRKVFAERLARFLPEERAMGWHVQYDEFQRGEAEFVRRPEELELWDGNAVRAEILGRAFTDTMRAAAVRDGDLFERPPAVEPTLAWLERATGRPFTEPDLQALMASTSQLLAIGADADTLAGAVAAEQAVYGDAAARLLAAEGRLAGKPRDAARAAALAQALARRVPPPSQTRSFAALAFADELVSSPELLTAYARAFREDDDVTLVIAAREDGSLLDELVGVLRDAGLAEGGPDILAVPVPNGEDVDRRFDGAVKAVFSRRPAAGTLSRLPRFDDATIDELRLAVAA